MLRKLLSVTVSIGLVLSDIFSAIGITLLEKRGLTYSECYLPVKLQSSLGWYEFSNSVIHASSRLKPNVMSGDHPATPASFWWPKCTDEVVRERATHVVIPIGTELTRRLRYRPLRAYFEGHLKKVKDKENCAICFRW